MANLLLHKSDIGIDREAHFHTTSYEKNCSQWSRSHFKKRSKAKKLTNN